MVMRCPHSKTCKCGCGETFQPKRRNQKFVNGKHRVRWHNDRINRIVGVVQGLDNDLFDAAVHHIEATLIPIQEKRNGSTKQVR